MLVANARMYAVTPQVRDAWRALFDWVSRYSGIPLVYVDHAAPAPLEELWSRHDLAATFMCGFPFASAAPKPLILAAPVPSPPRYRRQPVYCTDFVVRADGKYRNVSDTFGGRIGWTVPRFAVRIQRRPASPVEVPTRIQAIVHAKHRTAGDAAQGDRGGCGPRDRHWPARFNVRDLLERHEPATAAKLRTVDSTAMTPIPPLIASPSTPPDTIERLRHALLASPNEPEAAAILDDLLLSGFALVDAADYDRLLSQARETETAGYPVPS